ncbi:MAG: hypothetical protein CL840_21630 [Crocinitomicaceae bacterium]|nr:hypothetical protein [Crocinitomicaceae bacterium]|tara:strand:- start:2877 stop:3572 length:696 start_codon:yes stop_codon:yes gene_type:complete
MNWAIRSNEIELMDDLEIGGDKLISTLKEIDRINQLLGGFNSLIKRVEHYQSTTNSEVAISDLGCGSGWLLKQLESRLGKDSRLIGIDANASVVNYARSGYEGSISFKQIDVFDYIQSLDSSKLNIVLSSLFCHHFSNSELTRMIELLRTKNAVFIINDLHRHWLALNLFKLLGYAFNLGAMARTDGAISIRRGFKRIDWEQILSNVDSRLYKIEWKWAFRYQIEIANSWT